MVDINDMDNHQVFPPLSRIKCMPKNLAPIAIYNSSHFNFPNIKKFVPEDPSFVSSARTTSLFLISKNMKKFADQEQNSVPFV